MAKTIEFDYKGKRYTLEYNRKSIKAMEAQGFDLQNIVTKQVTTIEALFAGAFRMHHPAVSHERINEIFDTLTQKDKLVNALIEMYNSVLEDMIGREDDAEEEKNANWGANF